MERPNVLLIVMDTQRADNLSCYGYDKKTTPNIDKLASEGVLFLNNIIPGVWTLPSHASLFTGRYVSGHGADAHCERLMNDFPTFAELLGKLGYVSVGFSNNGWVSRRTGLARGFSEYYLIGRGSRKVVEWFYVDEESEKGEGDKGSLKTVNAAINWLEKKWSRDKPFFMFINFIEPHGPYWPPEPFRSMFLPHDVGEEELEKLPKLNSTIECIDIRVGALKLSMRQWMLQKALYDGCTATVDDRIGKLFSYLKESGLADDTIIIITSDHGDIIGEHEPHVEHHLCVYDELIRVPLVIWYPYKLPENRRVKWLSQTVDILPTVLDLVGGGEKLNKTIQGKSLLPTINDDEPIREYALIEYNKSIQQLFLTLRRHPNFDVRKFSYRIKAIRSLKYKYVWYSNGLDELFDLENDPAEKKNLANERPDLVAKMRGELEKILLALDKVDYGDVQAIDRRISNFGEESKRIYERLKAWGFYREIKPAHYSLENDIII